MEKEKKVEENKQIIKRVKVPTEKWATVVVILCGLLVLAFSLYMFIAKISVLMGILGAVLAALLLILCPISMIKQIKLSVATNTYPEDAIVVEEKSFDIVTDKTETFYFDQLQTVRGARYVRSGAYVNKFYYFGTLFLKFKDGRKILLKGIDNVSDVVKLFKKKMADAKVM